MHKKIRGCPFIMLAKISQFVPTYSPSLGSVRKLKTTNPHPSASSRKLKSTTLLPAESVRKLETTSNQLLKVSTDSKLNTRLYQIIRNQAGPQGYWTSARNIHCNWGFVDEGGQKQKLLHILSKKNYNIPLSIPISKHQKIENHNPTSGIEGPKI